MKQLVKVLAITLVLLLALTGCASTRQAYVFDIETGDSVEISMETKDTDYTLTQRDGHAYVSKAGEDVLDIYFITRDMYSGVMTVLDGDAIDYTSSGDKSYYKASYISDDGQSYTTYMMWLDDSDTGIIADSTATEDVADAAFSNVTFSIS